MTDTGVMTILTGSGVMIIFLYKGLTRNSKIRDNSFAQYLETGDKCL